MQSSEYAAILFAAWTVGAGSRWPFQEGSFWYYSDDCLKRHAAHRAYFFEQWRGCIETRLQPLVYDRFMDMTGFEWDAE